jgi:hypothetical protein
VLKAKSTIRKILKEQIDANNINNIWLELADAFSVQIKHYYRDESGNLKNEEFPISEAFFNKSLAFLSTEKAISILYTRKEACCLCEGIKKYYCY